MKNKNHRSFTSPSTKKQTLFWTLRNSRNINMPQGSTPNSDRNKARASIWAKWRISSTSSMITRKIPLRMKNKASSKFLSPSAKNLDCILTTSQKVILTKVAVIIMITLSNKHEHHFSSSLSLFSIIDFLSISLNFMIYSQKLN